MSGTEIDFGGIQQTPVPQQPWKPPRHMFFGPKDPATGQMIEEPVYVRDRTNPAQDFPRMLYTLIGNKISGQQVHSQDEQDALGEGWFDSPAAFGAVTAPTFEQTRQPPPKLSQPKLGLPKKANDE